MNLKKGKLVRGLFATLSLLLAFCMLATGCGDVSKKQFEKGFEYNKHGPIRLGVKSETDTFDVDNVFLDLYYGMYDINDYPDNGLEAKGSYIFADMGEDLLFGMYICDSNYFSDVINDKFISDYTKIENHYFVREISENDAFSKEYGYSENYWNNITYNHYEKISIPSEIFTNESGRFLIKIVGFQKPISESGDYYTNHFGYIELKYQKIDKSKVQIIFNI